MNVDVQHPVAPPMSSVGGQAMDVIDALAASQLGLVTRTQLIEAGVTRRAIAMRVRRRRLWLVQSRRVSRGSARGAAGEGAGGRARLRA